VEQALGIVLVSLCSVCGGFDAHAWRLGRREGMQVASSGTREQLESDSWAVGQSLLSF
jgi:hypothetical protein